MKTFTLIVTSFLLLVFGELRSQNLSKEQVEFLGSHAVSISTNNLESKSGFEEVKSNIGDKRFVLIGEFNHGSKEVFLIRNELIKYLNINAGFKVVLFESGIGELIYPDFNKEELSPGQMLYGFFGPWRTNEFKELMRYVKKEGMSMAGFDVQRTARTFGQVLEEATIALNLNPNLYSNLEAQFGKLKRDLSNRKLEYNDSMALKCHQLMNDYEELYSTLLNKQMPIPFNKGLLILRTIRNRIDYVDYMLRFKKEKNWGERWASRDSLMADNVIWLSETLYPSQKIIIVGHNFHLSKHNEKEEVMGEYLMKKYPNEMYSIGVYARTGQYLGNYGNSEELAPVAKENLDIKRVIGALSYEVSFLHIPEAPIEGDEWLRNEIITNDTFVNLSSYNKVTLDKNYDGLLLLQRISVPEK